MSRLWHSQAIILKRTSYGEADAVLQLLTQQRGKVGVIAKGVRRQSSRNAGGLELFAVSEVTLAEGRSGLDVLTGARLVKFYSSIVGDYDRLQLGYELIKMISRQSESVYAAEFFDLLKGSFDYLDQADIQPPLVEAWFRLQLAALLGQPLNVSRDVRGDKLEAGRLYNFNVQEASFVPAESGRWQPAHIKLLRLLAVKNPAQLKMVGGIGPYISDCLELSRLL